MARYIFITGGVVSSLGKGLMAASLGALLQARGYKVRIRKFDPYLNVDPGTMSPYQHGEVFVTDDGAETDLDLGHYQLHLILLSQFEIHHEPQLEINQTLDCLLSFVLSQLYNIPSSRTIKFGKQSYKEFFIRTSYLHHYQSQPSHRILYHSGFFEMCPGY